MQQFTVHKERVRFGTIITLQSGNLERIGAVLTKVTDLTAEQVEALDGEELVAVTKQVVEAFNLPKAS